MINNVLYKELISKPDAIIFDLCSTILNSNDCDIKAIDSVLIKFNKPKWNDGTNTKKDINKSMKENFINFFGHKDESKAYYEYVQVLLKNIHKMPLFTGTREILQFCKENRIKVILLSNRDKIFVDKVLEYYQLNSYFDDIITPESTKFKKPSPEMLTNSLKHMNLYPANYYNILLIGDSYVDIMCGLLSGCVPILNRQIKTDIDDTLLNKLKKVLPQNKIIVINNLNEIIIHLKQIDLSKKIFNKKISYIGAGGKIGKKSLYMICSQIPSKQKVQIVLIGSGTDESLMRLNGFVLDLKGSLMLIGNHGLIEILVTNDYSFTANSDIVICSAALWPTSKKKNKLNKVDPSGRIVQSIKNIYLLSNITKNIKQYCPDALFVIVTNQVDIMCWVARQIAPEIKILGLTGSVDSIRLKQVVLKEMNVIVDGFMIGYHNQSMIPMINSLKTINGEYLFPFSLNKVDFENSHIFETYERTKMAKIVAEVRTYGKKISTLQKAGRKGDEDTGASILPAAALARLIRGFCFGDEYYESFNIRIEEKKIADYYGVLLGSDLSIPVKISLGKVIILEPKEPLLEHEKQSLKEAMNDFYKSLIEFEGHIRIE